LTSDLELLRNKEAKFYGIDSQFLTEGFRLVLLLPGFSLLFLFGAWAYSGQSPEWWLTNLEPSVKFDLATGLTLIATTILLGFCAGLHLHRHRVRLTRMVFRSEVAAAAEAHRPVTSMHGYASVDGFISRTMTSHNTAFWMGVLATLIAVVVAYLDSESALGKRGLLASASLVTMAIGQHLSTRNRKFNMVTRDGLLTAYIPPLHPSTLEMVFNDMLRTQMDPLLRSKFDDFLLEFESHVREDVDREFAREKFLMLMHRRFKGSLDRNTTKIELGEILSDKGVHDILAHGVFNESLWDSLFHRSLDSYPAFYRLIDRLDQDLSIGRKPDMDELLFDVDLENVVSERANLFCYFHNLSDKERQVVLRVNSPDFRPYDLSLRYNLKPGQKSWWPEEAVPISSDGDDDQLGRMSGLLQDGTLAWQTLLPEKTGEASVSIRLENIEGDLLVGRQINVRVRPEFVNWFRNTSSLTSYFIGGIGLAGAIVFQLMAVLAAA
jgi:hypothetical protein|tara:strand:- start:50 stop:1531 length:1482 start_codon:yes stop_codon:yes gene_type:complete